LIRRPKIVIPVIYLAALAAVWISLGFEIVKRKTVTIIMEFIVGWAIVFGFPFAIPELLWPLNFYLSLCGTLVILVLASLYFRPQKEDPGAYQSDQVGESHSGEDDYEEENGGRSEESDENTDGRDEDDESDAEETELDDLDEEDYDEDEDDNE
jgi:hypothetical protein